MSPTMKIEVVSIESVRPSFPTPKNVSTYNLSGIDQLLPAFYTDRLLYYPSLDSNGSSLGDVEEDNKMIFSASSRRRCDVLKKSLAETLTRYYPLAGRIKDEKSVECNDEGVDYIEARVVGITVSQVIQLASSDIGVMEPFLPYEPYGATALRRGGIHSNSKALLKVQVNVFDCGGMVICFSYSHKVVDASSFLNFVNDWAATSRGGFGDKQEVAVVGKPCYILSSMFPPTSSGNQEKKDVAVTQIKTDKIEIATKRDTVAAKRFVFKNSSIAKLKNKFRSDYQVDKQEEQLPTRFEALTSLILMCILDVHRFKVQQMDNAVSDPKQYVVGFAINLRAKTIPPLPAKSFGNMIDTAIAEIPSNLIASFYDNGKGVTDLGQYYPELVSTIRESIKLVDNEHVEAMKRNMATSCNHVKMLKMIKEGIFHQNTRELLMFSSSCRFPVYEADFGWGKPTWASTSKQLSKNFVMYMDTSSGDGIEAWVSLEEEDMVEFERHQELLAFAS